VVGIAPIFIPPRAVHEQVYHNECGPLPSVGWASILQTFKMTALQSRTFLTGMRWSLVINICDLISPAATKAKIIAVLMRKHL